MHRNRVFVGALLGIVFFCRRRSFVEFAKYRVGRREDSNAAKRGRWTAVRHNARLCCPGGLRSICSKPHSDIRWDNNEAGDFYCHAHAEQHDVPIGPHTGGHSVRIRI